MLKDFLSFKNNFFYLSLTIILIFFVFSVNSYRFIYDGHHHGLVFSNALDLLNGKKPYKEIFIQYGIITTCLHAIILKIFGLKVIYINIFTSLIYSLTIILFYLIINKLINKKYAFYTILILLFNHPIIWLPWSNYISYFFITLSIYILFNSKNKNSFFSGLFLAMCCLSRQDYFIPIFFSFLIFVSFFLYFKKIFLYKFILGFIFPLILFFIYLLLSGVFFDWSKTIYLPSLYLEERGLSLFYLLHNFLSFIIFKAFLNFINEPQNLIISIIFWLNIFLLYYNLKKFKIEYVYLCFLSLSLSLTSINHETFRLYTSISLGIIPSIVFIYEYKKKEITKAIFYSFFMISFFSIIFYPKGGNDLFNKNLSTLKKSNIEVLEHIYLPPQTELALNEVNKIKKKLDLNCSIIYGENFTFDTMLISILNYDRIYYFPYVKSDTKNSRLMSFFDNDFIEKINAQIKKQNIVLISEEDNMIFSFGKIEFDPNYTYSNININVLNDKPKYLKFYYPKKCFN